MGSNEVFVLVWAEENHVKTTWMCWQSCKKVLLRVRLGSECQRVCFSSGWQR